MRIQIVHDRSGAILGALAQTQGDRAGTLIPVDDSQVVTEVDAADLDISEADLRAGEPSRHLADVVEHYRLENGRLVRRSGG